MKKITQILACAIVMVGFSMNAQENYVSISGKITNKNSDSLLVGNNSYRKKIIVKSDGTFSDTLNVKKGYYALFDGKEQTPLFLQNGFKLKLTLDCKEFDETITYSGVGADVNNFIAKRNLLNESELSDNSIFNLDKTAFEAKTKDIIAKYNDLLTKFPTLEPQFIEEQKQQTAGLSNYLDKRYAQMTLMNVVLGKGKPSPKFVNYENNNGGTTSLDDLKGKYVYLDIWATWCGPCKAEIPFLKEVEKKYHGKNIEFVSISLDEKKNYTKWKTMIKDKELSGIQLLADNNFLSSFVEDYKIEGIPRFILIDPQGNIVDADAPRPSDQKLIQLFEDLKI
ncbi:MAG: TlpA disulfide reductase family protein [Flavobacterium sp.]